MPRLLLAAGLLALAASSGCRCLGWPGLGACGDSCAGPGVCACAGECDAACGCGAGGCDACGHRPLLPHWLHRKPPVPSQQHADYVSPLPEYHPVPTRPVFEPLPTYTPPHLLDPPAKMHPMLEMHGGKRHLFPATSGYAH